MGSKRNRFKRRLQVLLHQIQHAVVRLGVLLPAQPAREQCCRSTALGIIFAPGLLCVGCSPMTSIRTRENRRNPRTEVSKGIWVSWQTTGASTVSRVRDLSIGGVFVSTPAPPPISTTVKLLFVLPEGEVRIEGIVRYAESKKGMGVEFTRMGTGDGARLRELMRRLSAPAQ